MYIPESGGTIKVKTIPIIEQISPATESLLPNPFLFALTERTIPVTAGNKFKCA